MINTPLINMIDWDLPLDPFKHRIREMIADCQKKEKVLVLPVKITPGPDFIFQLADLLGQVNCENCESECCKVDHGPEGDGVALMDSDRVTLDSLNLAGHIKGAGKNAHLELPCPFLKSNRCSIYPSRPFMCLIYPFQFGGYLDRMSKPSMSVSSACPEGRRITKQFYIMAWRIMQRFKNLTEIDFDMLLNSRGD